MDMLKLWSIWGYGDNKRTIEGRSIKIRELHYLKKLLYDNPSSESFKIKVGNLRFGQLNAFYRPCDHNILLQQINLLKLNNKLLKSILALIGYS